MAINLHNIKKWIRMILGKSILHVPQDVGRYYKVGEIKGYYNDMTEKVLRNQNNNSIGIPLIKVEKGITIEFPIAVFQYGLGLYDLLLSSNDSSMEKKFREISDWALNNQELLGSWDNFSYIYKDHKYSAMAQGQGASLLIRAYVHFKEIKYFEAAKKAIDFMLIPLENGGTVKHIGNQIFLQEFTNKDTVLNGWIFAIFGLYDFALTSNDDHYFNTLRITLTTLTENLHTFDSGYWSYYNITGSILSSRFYHRLHISLLKVLFELFKVEVFQQTYKKWEKFDRNLISRTKAFILKAIQKIIE